MDLYNIILLIIVFLNLGLAGFIFATSEKNRTTVSFALYAFFLAVWPATLLFFRWVDDPRWALFWIETAYVSAVCIAAAFWFFAAVFPENKPLPNWERFLLIFGVVSVTAVMYYPGLLARAMMYEPWGKWVLQNPMGYFIFSVFFYFFYFGGVIRIFRKYLHTVGIIRMQLLYIILSVASTGMLGVFFNLILPSPFFHEWRYIWVGPIFTMCVLFGIAYAVFKYQLMDIHLVIKRSTVFVVLVVTLTAIYTLAVFWFTTFFEKYLPFHPVLLTGLIISVLLAVGFEPLKRFLQKSTDRIFFQDEYQPQQYLNSVTNLLSTSLNFYRITRQLMRSLLQTFKLEKAALLLMDAKTGTLNIEFLQGFHALTARSFHLHDVFTRYFIEVKEPLIYEQFQRWAARLGLRKKKKWSELLTILENIGAAVYIPLFYNERLSGVIVLSEKKSGDIFTQQDVQVLTIVASQAAIAFENARLYQEARRFNVVLKHEVEKATNDLKKLNTALQHANARLKELDKAKSEFISIASHQLRTPLTIIKGYISMSLEGSFGKINARIRESLDKVFQSNERIIHLVDDLLNVSRIENKRLQYQFQSTDLKEIVQSTIDELQPQAKEKKLELRVDLKSDVPAVKADAQKIRQVAMNLIDNALKYTNEGWVAVSVFQKKKQVVFQVQDSGVGIPRKDMKRLFEKFSRIKDGVRLNTEGTGLGLFVAKKIIEAHGGKIHVTSDGLNKGSTFSVILNTF